jgi:hypothetical protein
VTIGALNEKSAFIEHIMFSASSGQVNMDGEYLKDTYRKDFQRNSDGAEMWNSDIESVKEPRA